MKSPYAHISTLKKIELRQTSIQKLLPIKKKILLNFRQDIETCVTDIDDLN